MRSEPIMFSCSLEPAVKMSLSNLQLLHWSSSAADSRKPLFYWAAPSGGLREAAVSGQFPNVCNRASVKQNIAEKSICVLSALQRRIGSFSFRWKQLENSLLDINDCPPCRVCLNPLSISDLSAGVRGVVHLQTAMLKAQRNLKVFISASVSQI